MRQRRNESETRVSVYGILQRGSEVLGECLWEEVLWMIVYREFAMVLLSKFLLRKLFLLRYE